jgi:hypothetical protein
MHVTHEQIASMFEPVSGIALKHWLRLHKYYHSAGSNEELYKKLASYVRSGDIGYDKLKEAACDIEESGGKRIFLFEGKSRFRSESDFRKSLRRLHIESDQTRRLSIKLPKKPTLNYVIWRRLSKNGKQEIRAKYSETHVNIKVNKERRVFEETSETKLIVVVHCIQNGTTQVRFDSPGDTHHHKNTDGVSSTSVYHEFYFRKAVQLVGIGLLSPMDLRPAMEYLANKESPRVFRLPHHVVRTGFNSILRCDAPSRDADVRDDPAHRGAARADKKNWAQEELKGYLIRDPDKSAYRDVWMGILPKGEIWFRRDCLEEEIDHAISRIK